MRLDHLLSKEKEKEAIILFNFEGFKESSQRDGGVAQLGEHLPCTQGVRSSNLLISTRGKALKDGLIAQVVRAHA